MVPTSTSSYFKVRLSQCKYHTIIKLVKEPRGVLKSWGLRVKTTQLCYRSVVSGCDSRRACCGRISGPSVLCSGYKYTWILPAETFWTCWWRDLKIFCLPEALTADDSDRTLLSRAQHQLVLHPHLWVTMSRHHLCAFKKTSLPTEKPPS